MNHELITVIDQLCKEKGISKDVLLEAVESALVSAARKKFPDNENIVVKVNPKNGSIAINLIYTIVEEVEDENNEMSLAEAREIDPNAQVGNEAVLQQDFEGYGRMLPRLQSRSVRRSGGGTRYYYKPVLGPYWRTGKRHCVRHEKGNYIIDIGKTELSYAGASQENYKQETDRAYLLDA
jgi:N utilization substance protein A